MLCRTCRFERLFGNKRRPVDNHRPFAYPQSLKRSIQLFETRRLNWYYVTLSYPQATLGSVTAGNEVDRAVSLPLSARRAMPAAVPSHSAVVALGMQPSPRRPGCPGQLLL
jgi:hypothetical protein